VIQSSGASLDIPPGKTEITIGREDPVSGIFPEIDLDPHGGHDGGVGRKHARLFMQGGQLMIEDLNSVNGTILNKQKLPPKQPQPVMDGAEIRFGRVVTTYHAN
jgi:pSer/pThr/pTyr-binding forkhead associated (FHA) protein